MSCHVLSCHVSGNMSFDRNVHWLMCSVVKGVFIKKFTEKTDISDCEMAKWEETSDEIEVL